MELHEVSYGRKGFCSASGMSAVSRFRLRGFEFRVQARALLGGAGDVATSYQQSPHSRVPPHWGCGLETLGHPEILWV